MNSEVIIIYKTIYSGATLKLANAMAKEIGCLAVPVADALKIDLSPYKHIGLGSGIFFASHHPEILRFARYLSPEQNVFIFSSHGAPFLGKYHQALKNELKASSVRITGEFSCVGYDRTGPFNIFGGAWAGRPNERDRERAKKFVRTILPQYAGNAGAIGDGRHIGIQYSKCIGCGTCADVCPMNVYGLAEGKFRPVREEECVHCGLCVENCPEKAISVRHSFFEYLKIAKHHAKRVSLY